MKKYFFLVVFSLYTSFSFAQNLSVDATISLLTVSPGEELYSTFGHSAIRIHDPRQGLDFTFNYGAFDFRTKGFYIKFLRGTLPYQISGNYFENDMAGWTQENRSVTEQVLNLSQAQKQAVYDFLQNNYLPQNREYAYKFFYDNCSTRLRDVLRRVCADSLQLSKTLHADSSYRQWIDVYARKNEKLWADFGMDLAIGEPSDEITGANGAMFLPDNLMDAFDAAKINKNGVWQPLVLSKAVINRHMLVVTDKEKELVTPNILFWTIFIFVLGFTAYQFKSLSTNFTFDKILFSVAGFFGWFIVLLWFFTDHGVTENNLNIIWTYPLLLPIALFLKKDTKRAWLSKHFLAYGIILILFLVAWNSFPQEINYALVPVVLTLAVRAFFVWWRIRKKLSSF
ncbi:hypothetical protein Emtol_3725 [Emticicia oligotrophica DSM 17448]|uniref:DUF4105 domain-containing protein n=1 Tax=Emticicia oligotrophica (strain DSM 17448 / CIP 109782 / MTCC 6937 / GPTSA100-15) TaxID=929562 RepID=A0ABN4AST3_EMTOG|nr:DUF4105 domain-containing protein [Emticicia oligotrophica]AFK04851.1 hypothetical protein Emtol_3725 [Emticicia oligotrophica DSM 17448]